MVSESGPPCQPVNPLFYPLLGSLLPENEMVVIDSGFSDALRALLLVNCDWTRYQSWYYEKNPTCFIYFSGLCFLNKKGVMIDGAQFSCQF